MSDHTQLQLFLPNYSKEENDCGLFEQAWKLYQDQGYILILQIAEGEHPDGVSEEALILARMAESMARGELYQHNGDWKYRKI